MRHTSVSLALIGIFISFMASSAFADGIQMLPPVDPNPVQNGTNFGTAAGCKDGSGINRILTWDGNNTIHCSNTVRTDGAGDVSATGSVQVGNNVAACTSANAGAIRFNPQTSTFEGCNGTAWVAFGGGLNLGKGVNYSNSDIYDNILKTPVPYNLCVLSMAGVASCGRCVVSENSDGTWSLDQASCNPGIPNASYTWCGMTCYN